MPRKHRFESSALRFTYDRYVGADPKRRAAFEEARAHAEVAYQIYSLRAQAGLTQSELALLVGTTASAISRLEDADYGGHSLGMLRRIAAVLGRRVEIRFVPLRRPASPLLHAVRRAAKGRVTRARRTRKQVAR